MTGNDRPTLADRSIQRPIGTLAIASVVFVLGLFFIERLPVDLLPTVEYPNIRITVNYPGVAPEVMEEQVTRVLERHLAITENLAAIDSRASQGRTNVNLRFELGTNLDLALQDASRNLELARTQLPQDIEPPRIYKFDPAQDPIWIAGFSSSIRSETEVRDWAENDLAPQLLTIPGVSGVEAAGGQVREIEVVVDQQRLQSYGLSMQSVAAALAEENVDIAAGWVTSHTYDVMAKTDGLLASVDQIQDILIALPGSQRRHVRLGELAEIRDGHREQRMFIRLNGAEAAQLAIYKLPDANTVAVVDDINTTLARLQRSGFIPGDLQFSPVRDPSFFIRGAIGSVATAAVLGGVLAMIMVTLFLGSLRKGFVIGASIPIALMATFALMGIGNLTLNIISLGGLALGVGLLLDNAIVVLENIYRHREKLGESATQAAHNGTREVVSAITAGTLTNLAAVVPFLLITGLAALVFRDLILTLSFAILTTLAAAITLVPMGSALLGRVRFSSGLAGTRVILGFDGMIDWLREKYGSLMTHVLRWRWLVLAIAALLLVGAVQLLGSLGQTFLPQVDDGEVSVRVMMPPGTPPEASNAAARQVEAVVREQPHVRSVFTFVGGHLGGGTINERPGRVHIDVALSPARDRPDLSAGQWVQQTQKEVREIGIPGAQISVRPPRIRGLRFTAQGDDLSIGIVGGSHRELRAIATEVNDRLQGIPGLEGVELSRDDENPLLRIFVDRDRAASYGLRVADVGRALRDAVDGSVPTRYSTGNQDYDIRVRLPQEQATDADTLSQLLLFRQNGEAILLSDVARFELGEGPAHIERENQSRIVRVVGSINTEVSDVATIMHQVEDRLAELELPQRVNLIFGGQWETIQDTQRELRTVILLSLFLVFVVLAVQYERITNPLVILTAAPLAIIGVAGMLWATGTDLSAPAMIGMVLLIGIVVNNAILLLEYVELGRREQGLEPFDAVISACKVRLRPILMTTSTTVLGMLPLAIGLGEGAEVMRPLALTVVGGLLVSMLLTLVVIPSLYLVADKAAAQMTGWLTGRT